MVYQREINIQTRGHKEMHDLTKEITRVVGESKVQQGIAHIFNIGSTGAIGTIEFEPGLEADLPEMLDKLIPPSRDYGHERTWHDGNGHSHLQATLLGPSLTVPVKDGKLAIMKTPNGENPLVHGAKPVLGCDVWEHSYYIDYRNRRPDYLKAFLDNLVNWDHAEEMYEAAIK